MIKDMTLCACGCGQAVRTKGAKYNWGHHARMPEYWRRCKERPAKQCQRCGSEFMPSHPNNYAAAKYCTKACSDLARRKGVTLPCVRCGTLFYRAPRMVRRNALKFASGGYCSRECQQQDAKERALHNQRAGNYRSNAWKVYERKCYDCGYDAHPEIILIHHIDGDRSNGALSNLIPLCQNCHCLRHIAMRGSAQIPSSRRHSA